MSGIHGNSRKSDKLHHLYAIHDREEENIFKYGISGEPLSEDDKSSRAEGQISIFNKLVGWSRFFVEILRRNIAGRKKADKLERRFIDDFTEEHGKPPRGNV
ncbi:MAG: hypothetical protein ACI85O_001843 [Saprospiraceae bacterium]|jgi:hypothetical protein